MRRKKISFVIKAVFLLGIFLTVSSCSEVTKPEEAARIRINQILDALEEAVFLYDSETFIGYLHNDFFHNGNDKDTQIFLWQQRLLHFNTMYLENREVFVYNYLAEVEFQMTLIGTDTTVVSQEPSSDL